MPMMIVTAKELRYAGRSMKEGEEFDVPLRDGNLLKAVGKAAFKGEPPAVVGNPPKRPPQPAQPDLLAAPPPASPEPEKKSESVAPMTTEAAGDIVPGRRRYNRRDLTSDT